MRCGLGPVVGWRGGPLGFRYIESDTAAPSSRPRPSARSSRPRAPSAAARQIRAKIALPRPKLCRPVDRRRLLHVRRRSCWPAAATAARPGGRRPSFFRFLSSWLCLRLRQALGAGVLQGCHQQQHLKMTSSSSDGKWHASSLCSPLPALLSAHTRAPLPLLLAILLASFSPLLSVMCMCRCGSTPQSCGSVPAHTLPPSLLPSCLLFIK